MKNDAAVAAKSSGKDRANEKTFRIPVSTGILEHCPEMLDSFWLFVWYIDKTTIEENGEGSILGGMPIVDSKPASILRVPVKTVRRWRQHLEDKGYIRTVRTPYGHVITLLKSKKWNWGPALVTNKPDPRRDLPKAEISTSKESSHFGHSDLPNRAVRVPETGSQSSRNGKYKEDKAVDSTGQNSRHDSRLTASAASPLKSKPSGKGKTQLGFAQTASEIAKVMNCWRGTIGAALVEWEKPSYMTSLERAEEFCRKRVRAFEEAFAAIRYPFDVLNPVLGVEFCENVERVVNNARGEKPQPRAWELCERVLDRCDQSWDEAQTYSDVNPPYWPPDFNDHINHLFELEER